MWNSERGYGFIVPDDGSDDLFAHVRHLLSSGQELRQGQRVRYEARRSERYADKSEAYNVALI
jgi:CspA family cold shock protein